MSAYPDTQINAQPPKLDFRDPAYHANPYPLLAALREHDPVHFTEQGFWLITRHADVDMLIRSPKMGKKMSDWPGYQILRPFIADSALERNLEQWMFYLDPPAHTRIRALVHKAFTPRMVEQMKDEIRRIAESLLDDMEGKPVVDLMTEFAQPLPVRVIAKILDLPIYDFEQLKLWSDALAWTVEINFPRARKQAANEAIIGMEAYLRQRIAERRASPGDDLLGQLIAVEEGGERLSETELIANLAQLFVAGHETTTNLIGNGMLALLRHPDQLARLRADFSLLPTAIEEFLRYESPANVLFRITREEIEVGGKRIEPNQLVLNMLGAANHDPAVFDHPDELDITRQPNPQLSFGGGIHYCPGAPLARLEAQVAFECLLKRFPQMTVDESGLAWRTFINLRGLEHLPVNVNSE